MNSLSGDRALSFRETLLDLMMRVYGPLVSNDQLWKVKRKGLLIKITFYKKIICILQ